MSLHDVDRDGPVAATRRDLAADALVLGAAAFVWFGWAQEGPPPGWSPLLAAGSGLGVLLALLSLIVLRRREDGSAMAQRAGRRAYGVTVGLAVALTAVGAAALGLTGHSRFLSRGSSGSSGSTSYPCRACSGSGRWRGPASCSSSWRALQRSSAA